MKSLFFTITSCMFIASAANANIQTPKYLPKDLQLDPKVIESLNTNLKKIDDKTLSEIVSSLKEAKPELNNLNIEEFEKSLKQLLQFNQQSLQNKNR